ncbi:MAG: argininosuccinate lyase [Deltaproteobacteria bacterium CG11_big_fil_rev_8_21_14_0_20_49_13]|nr:MAG: argininosuccinate lyase [Deltaproteobacteria bacterium CG11_big_fil_rev_8_21_14_0_20_49_13]
MAVWSSRIKESPSDIMKRVNNSLAIDIRLLPFDARLTLAWGEEISRLGILNEKELGAMKKALPLIVKKYSGHGELPDDEDVHSLIERELTEAAGNVGRKIHLGKSRNDQVVTGLMMFLKESVTSVKRSLLALGLALTESAEKNTSVVMPGYTHLRQAQPVRFSHYLLSFAAMVEEDIRRLDSYTENELSECPLGSGAFAGTTLKIDRDSLAKKLGFKNASLNSIKSVSDRAFVISLASILSIIAMHLSRYAEDLVIWSGCEFGFLELPASTTTGSSMMPQKKNPDSLELIRALTGRTNAALTGLLTISKGVPLTYAKDLQDDKRFIFDSIDAVYDGVRLFTEVIEGAKFRADKMTSSIETAALATDAADLLVSEGIPFRQAYEKVASNIEGIKELNITPESSVERRGAKGGTSRSSVKEQISYFRKVFDSMSS